MNENSFWTGVITGFICSMILFCITGFIGVNKIKSLESNIKDLQTRQANIEQRQSDNDTIMQTYKFFNESW